MIQTAANKQQTMMKNEEGREFIEPNKKPNYEKLIPYYQFRDEDANGRTSSQGSSSLSHPPWRVTFVVFKFIIGTGILSMPKSMEQTGILLFIMLLLFFGGMAWAGCVLIANSLDIVGRSDCNMAQLGQIALGTKGFWLASLVGSLDCWGAVFAYWTALVGIVQPYLQDESMLGADNIFGQTPLLTILIAAAIFPMCLLRKLNTLGVIATAGSIVLFGLVVALGCMSIVNGHGFHGLPAVKSGLQTALAAGSIAFSYDCQVNIFANYRELDEESGKKAPTLIKCSAVAIAGSMVVYFTTALAGYSLYGELVKGNVLNNMSQTAGPIILNLLMFLVVVPDIPLLSFEVATIMQDHLLGRTFRAWFASNFIFIGTSVVVAIYVPSMQVAFAYVGATTAVGLNAILPPLFYLCLTSGLYFQDEDARNEYVKSKLEAIPSALPAKSESEESEVPYKPELAPLPDAPSTGFRQCCYVYLVFGCLLLPTMIVLVALGQ